MYMQSHDCISVLWAHIYVNSKGELVFPKDKSPICYQIVNSHVFNMAPPKPRGSTATRIKFSTQMKQKRNELRA